MTKAPLGGEKTGANPTDRGKDGVKRSLLTEGSGGPIGPVIDGANRHDMKRGRDTIESIEVERPEPGEDQPQGMTPDKGSDDDHVREIFAEFGFTAHSRDRGEEAKEPAQEAGKRARRRVVERIHSLMNRLRCILVRREKKPDHYLAFLHVACALIAFRASGVFG